MMDENAVVYQSKESGEFDEFTTLNLGLGFSIRVDSRDWRAISFEGDRMTHELIYKEECYWIIGACFEVYNEKGCGFLEPVYQECMEIELEFQKVAFTSKEQLKLFYRGRELKQKYIPDFICFGKIIVELKAVSNLTDKHRAQVINYLNATGYQLGLLINFGGYPKIEWERLVYTKKRVV